MLKLIIELLKQELNTDVVKYDILKCIDETLGMYIALFTNMLILIIALPFTLAYSLFLPMCLIVLALSIHSVIQHTKHIQPHIEIN